MKMKIEAGKFYKTRDGRKVEIVIDHGDCLMGHIVGGEVQKLWLRNGTHGAQYVANKPYDDLIAEWVDAPTGPVREVTRKEIVPGVYGRLSVARQTADTPRILIALANEAGVVQMTHHGWSLEDVQAAAAVLTQLAEALESQP